MGALDTFLAKGIRFELLTEDQIRAQGALDDSLREAIKAAKPNIINELQWREFEALLGIVGPTYKTPDDEYAQIRAAARRDLPAALLSYRILLKQRTSDRALNE
jgi:hypothetical protein